MTKNALLRAMLRQAQQQVAYRYLPLAGRQLLRLGQETKNMHTVRELGHEFILALEKSRTVASDEAGRKASSWPSTR